MAFNNNFQNYPQYYAPQPPSNNIIWVSGETGAKSYLVAPNTTVQLWDSESQIIYLKSADASGMPTMKILDYTIRDNQESKIELTNEPDIKKELKELKNQIEKLQNQIERRSENE